MKIITLSLLGALSLGFSQMDNTVYGTGAGISITNGDSNTIMGDSAGASLTYGSLNTFLGEDAGRSQTTASDNNRSKNAS